MNDGWKMMHDVVHMIANRTADLESDREHCIGPMEEIGILERIEELTDLQLQIQEKLQIQLAETADSLRRSVTHGDEAKRKFKEAEKEIYDDDSVQ